IGKKELLTTILEDLGIEYKSTSKTHLLSALNKYLLEQAAKDVNVVLIIDEAQNLAPSVLEEVRMLSNLETEREKLIQIVLMGQPELRKKLAMPKLEQFRQRVVLHYHLEPLTRGETKEYIRHRLNKAGNKDGDVFDDGAIDAVYEYSKGVPRLINVTCHHALIEGLVRESKCITCGIVKESIEGLLQSQNVVDKESVSGERFTVSDILR
nr:AAA family ATPase [Candidatus Omnitrophota bacterium]